MNSSDIPRCAECGGELPPGLPRGLCPRCALGTALNAGAGLSSTPASSAPAPSLPRAFGDYELLEEIARARIV